MKIAQRYFNRGNAKIDHKDYAGAITLFDKGIENNPEFAWAYLNRGIAKNFSLENEGISNYFSGNLEIDQVDPSAIREMGLTSTSGSHISAVVLADFDKAIGINPWFAKAYFSRGMVKSGLDNHSKVSTQNSAYSTKKLNVFNSTGKKPHKLEYWHDDQAGVMADFDKAIEIDPEFAEAYYTRGLTKNYCKSKPNSLLDRLKVNTKNNITVTGILSEPDLSPDTDLKDFGGAIADFDKAIDINPEYADAYYCRGLAKNYYQDPLLQITKLPEISEVKTEYATISQKRGSAMNGQPKDYQGIIADFDMAIKNNPRHAKAYCSRGLVKIFCQDQWEILTEEKPGEQSDNSHLTKGVKNYNFKNYSGAIADFDKAIEINSRFANAYYYRGIAKFYCYDHSGAISDCNKAIEIDPAFADDFNNSGLSKGFPGNAERGYLN